MARGPNQRRTRTKQSCEGMALKRCMVTDMLESKKIFTFFSDKKKLMHATSNETDNSTAYIAYIPQRLA